MISMHYQANSNENTQVYQTEAHIEIHVEVLDCRRAATRRGELAIRSCELLVRIHKTTGRLLRTTLRTIFSHFSFFLDISQRITKSID